MLKMAAKGVTVILSVLTGFALHPCLVLGKQADKRVEQYDYERKAGV